jgi:hypothetical protein
MAWVRTLSAHTDNPEDVHVVGGEEGCHVAVQQALGRLEIPQGRVEMAQGQAADEPVRLFPEQSSLIGGMAAGIQAASPGSVMDRIASCSCSTSFNEMHVVGPAQDDQLPCRRGPVEQLVHAGPRGRRVAIGNQVQGRHVATPAELESSGDDSGHRLGTAAGRQGDDRPHPLVGSATSRQAAGRVGSERPAPDS